MCAWRRIRGCTGISSRRRSKTGAKGILCEKPLALSLEDGDAIVAACRSTGCVLSVNHSRRWNPAFIKAKEMLDDGAIGDLISMLGICQGGQAVSGVDRG